MGTFLRHSVYRHSFSEKYCSGCRRANRVAIHTWLSENFCNALSHGAWFSTQNAPETFCQPGSAWTHWGLTEHPTPCNWIWGGTPGTGNGQKGGTERKKWMERIGRTVKGMGRTTRKREGSIPALLFLLPPLLGRRLCYSLVQLRRSCLHKEYKV